MYLLHLLGTWIIINIILPRKRFQKLLRLSINYHCILHHYKVGCHKPINLCNIVFFYLDLDLLSFSIRLSKPFGKIIYICFTLGKQLPHKFIISTSFIKNQMTKLRLRLKQDWFPANTETYFLAQVKHVVMNLSLHMGF